MSWTEQLERRRWEHPKVGSHGAGRHGAGGHGGALASERHGARQDHPHDRRGDDSRNDRRLQERAAKDSLRMQIARLERRLSLVVSSGFPNVATAAGGDLGPLAGGALDLGERLGSGAGVGLGGGPRLLSLAELERRRDALVARVRATESAASARARYERRARALLAEMKLEPRRHKFARLRVADLGEGGCGVWRVCPRLGLVGMLAGWWEVKLSSGCP